MKVGVVTPPDMSINFRKVREIGDLLRSGALVYVDEDGNVLQPDESAPVREERGDTYR